VAAVTRSDYEQYAHERVGATVGLSDAELDGIRTGAFAHAEGVDREEAMTCLVARRLAERRVLDGDDDYAAAVGVLGEQRLLELVVLVGYYAMLAQMMGVFGVGAPDEARTPHTP
jgi:4-carboxymuconolactone decarboxylase